MDEPESGTETFALFAHCFTCSKDILAASRIARALAERGIGVLRFDFTGLGHSAGAFEQTTFTTNIDDLLAAAAWLRSERHAPRILIGHSLGGAAVLAAAHQVPEAVAVSTIGAPADPGHVVHLFQDAADEIERTGQAEVAIGGRPFKVGKGLIDDLRQQDPETTIGQLGKALMIFHAPRDTIVGIDNAAKIFQWAKHPKSFVSLDTADHLVTKPRDAAYIAEVLTAWATRFVDATN